MTELTTQNYKNNNYHLRFFVNNLHITDSGLFLKIIAYKNQYYAVCVNSCNVQYVSGYIKKTLNDALKIVSVVGFPLGAAKVDAKVFDVIEEGKSGKRFKIKVAKLSQLYNL